MSYIRHEEFIRQFGEKVRQMRENRGITQQELALRTGMSRNQVSRIERGEINTSISVVFELAKGLECEVGELFSSGDRNSGQGL